jgi:hypothetical protein
MLVQENGGRKTLDTVRRTRHDTGTTLRECGADKRVEDEYW